MKIKDNKKGITLIALVITIIVLIILAGISINLILGENGILKKATNAAELSKMKQVEEEIKLILSEWHIENESNNILLKDFLDSKVNTEELDDKHIEITKDGYTLVVDVNGNITEEIKKTGPKPKISNIKITLENSEEEVNDYSQSIGTKLVISFETSIEGGEITKVTPSNTFENGIAKYTTNGTETEFEFVVKGIVEGKESTKKQKISVGNKYLKSVDSLIEGVSEITKSGKNKIQVDGKNETVIYDTDVIYYSGNLILDGTTNVTGATLESKVYEFGDASLDVATASTNAKNMVILKVDGNLTIDEGVTLTACKSASGYGGPKGFLIYCTGILTNNGTISMTARGAKAVGQNVYLWKNAEYDTEDKKYEFVPAVGAKGGAKVEEIWRTQVGNAGYKGTNRSTAGGGSGSTDTGRGDSNYGNFSGAGGNGTSYSGGAGGGGAYAGRNVPTSGSSEGGIGGTGAMSGNPYVSLGGVGNPGYGNASSRNRWTSYNSSKEHITKWKSNCVWSKSNFLILKCGRWCFRRRKYKYILL